MEVEPPKGGEVPMVGGSNKRKKRKRGESKSRSQTLVVGSVGQQETKAARKKRKRKAKKVRGFATKQSLPEVGAWIPKPPPFRVCEI